ncbi:hypothetical protein CC80DRAFT_546858 [Byssothecium circinans]|uniref:Glucose-methanol-choline oxidoreductase N-terminal domain-containing protein n=1 Tax=Byssothecium circinans TaxID=147558 RepID=A0A6A5U9K3_9PLEO|nr:hypothetical protein CC80DRAFT_546858 [Byssothecium circinans]
MFTTGETANGCGHAVRSIYKGVRTCSTDYLAAAIDSGKLNILSGQYVDKILVNSADIDGIRASAVSVRNANGEEKLYEARKEVILTAGAYGSSANLSRSGIGPVAGLKAVGVEPVWELPGVGKNLVDHLFMLSFYKVSQADLTNDHLIWHTGGKEKTMQQYKLSQTCFFSQFPFGAFAFERPDDRL